ncbi:MAG: pyridoxal 5'-phosphate synthase glutaminase subunit PdxT [Actinomycetota bacterium]|jgi:5'-phosphate synthase pdxT subunit|nr:pyridoxal 5'-phosphate synthase glutaminase subunit PdxT [Actinomycetota bacterium]
MRIGVLALQGAFEAHLRAFSALSIDTIAVRTPSALAGIDGLVIPGGESTALSMLIQSAELEQPLRSAVVSKLPLFGTCAGMILLADEVTGRRPDQVNFDAIDIAVERNGYGRQLQSFEADLDLDVTNDRRFRGVFIRAPRVTRLGPGVRVLARHLNDPVLVQEGRTLVASFHPELTSDLSLHQYFITNVVRAAEAA